MYISLRFGNIAHIRLLDVYWRPLLDVKGTHAYASTTLGIRYLHPVCGASRLVRVKCAPHLLEVAAGISRIGAAQLV